MSVRRTPQPTDQSWGNTKATDTRNPLAHPTCPECGNQRTTYEALRTHRALAHGLNA